jgi:hypothetical protein
MTKGNAFSDVSQLMYKLLFIKEEMPGVESIMLFVKEDYEHSLEVWMLLTMGRKYVKSFHMYLHISFLLVTLIEWIVHRMEYYCSLHKKVRMAEFD